MALQTAQAALGRAEAFGLLFMKTEAQRGLAHVRFRRGELAEALQLCDAVLQLTAGREPRMTRLLMGPLHVELLLAAGHAGLARDQLEAYRSMAAECQSPFATREVARLESLLPSRR